MDLLGNDGNVGYIPEAIGEFALDLETGILDKGEPFGGSLQGNVSRVLVADPFTVLPRLEQGIEVRRGKDECAALLGHRSNFVDGFLRVRQMFDDVFNDDHIERAVLVGKFLRAGGL